MGVSQTMIEEIRKDLEIILKKYDMTTTTSSATKTKKGAVRGRANSDPKRDRVLTLLHSAQFKTAKKTDSVALVRKDHS